MIFTIERLSGTILDQTLPLLDTLETHEAVIDWLDDDETGFEELEAESSISAAEFGLAYGYLRGLADALDTTAAKVYQRAVATVEQTERPVINRTAAGSIVASHEGKAPTRGNTTVWFGRENKQDSKWVVTSRFQFEVITGSAEEAWDTFTKLVPEWREVQ